MNILHVTRYCHVSSVGGTERYIHDLLLELRQRGMNGSILWLSSEHPEALTLVDSEITVYRLPSPPMPVDQPSRDLRLTFAGVLRDNDWSCVHFHTFGLSEALLAEELDERSIPYVFTYHSPAWSCRGVTLLRNGSVPCDGQVRAWRCSACLTTQRCGGSQAAGQLVAGASALLGWLALPLRSGHLRRRMAVFYDTANYRFAFAKFLRGCNTVIACSDWGVPVLELNGADAGKIVRIPQGVSSSYVNVERTLDSDVSDRLSRHFVIGYVGRVLAEKGVHLLVDAMRQLDDDDIRLRIIGWPPTDSLGDYHRELLAKIVLDDRIELVPQLGPREIQSAYRGLSLLAIPSVWFETGPLTLFEALSLGVPVLGTDRVGQLELLRKQGAVVSPNTADSWAKALGNAFSAWRRGEWAPKGATGHVRTMGDVADDTLGLYAAITG